MDTITSAVETREAALRRLLTIARESGVRLGVDRDGDFWAASVSEPGRLYPVGPESCGCRGFATHRRCRHVAALWSHLGWLDLASDIARSGARSGDVGAEPARDADGHGAAPHIPRSGPAPVELLQLTTPRARQLSRSRKAPLRDNCP